MQNPGKIIDCQLRVKHKDGSWRTVEAKTQNLLHDPKIGGIVVNYHDITERKRVQEELEKSEKKYRQLVETLYEGIWAIDKESNTTFVNPRMAEMLGYTMEEMVGKHLFAFMDERGVDVAQHYLDCCQRGPWEQHDFEFLRKDGTRLYASLAASPIFDDIGDYAGALAAVQDITERREASNRLEQSVQKLERSLDGTIQAMTRMVDSRDSYTVKHQRRVAQLGCAIAREMRFTAEQLQVVRIAGLLHDIGMISVPMEILSRDGKVTSVEFELIKAHCQAGYDILKTVEFPWPIATIVVQHHERLNGSGYPSGIRGDKILMEARVLGIADVVEAMNSSRSYRPKPGMDKALEQISRNSGILYDASVVEACMRLITHEGFQFED